MVLVGVLSVGSLVLAEGNILKAINIPASPAMKEKIKDKKTEVKNEVRNLRDDIQKKTQEFKDTIKVKKAELENQIKVKRDELKVNLKKIKDTTKQQAVQKIDNQIDDLNSQMMVHFSDMLDKMSAVLVKIGDRVDRASQQGYDVSSVRTALDNANKAIVVARSAIVAQSSKTYIIKITTKNGLRGSVGRARDALHADLTTVKNAVQAANEAVRKAAVTLGQLRGQSPLLSPLPSPSVLVTPTPTPTPNPTQ